MLIKIKEGINLFGFIDGTKFYFRMNFLDPLQQFIFLNISHKPYCTYSGFYCKKDNCEYKHLLTKKEIKTHWEKMEVEINTLEDGEGGKCVYCGENDGTKKIPNPNFDKLNYWWVCDECKEIIEIQQKLALSEIIGDIDGIEECNNKLLKISQRTGKPILNACIEKDKEGHYHSNSIIFTGEKKWNKNN